MGGTPTTDGLFHGKSIPVQVFSGKSEGSTPLKHVRFPRAPFSENPYILSASDFLRAIC